MAKEASRTSRNHTYERGLVDTLLDHNVPKYKGQNGWTPEGWKTMADKFNQKFPLARFTKQQIQEKEKELKGNYEAVRDARKQSGVGWNESLCMIIAEPDIWENKLVKDFPKVKKFRSKPFTLFNSLCSLYEGSVATGDLNFVSVQQVAQHVDLTTDPVSPTVSSANHHESLNPFSYTSLDGHMSSTDLHGPEASRREDAEPTTSALKEEPPERRKQSQVAVVLEEYLDFRKKQSMKFIEEIKEPKPDEKFSIAACVSTLEEMEGLTDWEKGKALRLFKC
ncbi:uncharacterized protein LOC100842185 [Brachypodium distachyon]|uniref:Myb/SANT-like domain-containing protein n=1 Tax=Brachypodium distachyon TaxID=15368 RepID=I1GSD9_BRADI|nr:uncharacterized protein LOC100842185 [Brachypodium distachyon]KQK15264.2 hypothetical protein BRADI_1g21520v3 [Brachypodium distachyon]|eukprot:XP_010229608.1 uncharacterized protein LOC100842185 [Brachypodium distachyon]